MRFQDTDLHPIEQRLLLAGCAYDSRRRAWGCSSCRRRAALRLLRQAHDDLLDGGHEQLDDDHGRLDQGRDHLRHPHAEELRAQRSGFGQMGPWFCR